MFTTRATVIAIWISAESLHLHLTNFSKLSGAASKSVRTGVSTVSASFQPHCIGSRSLFVSFNQSMTCKWTANNENMLLFLQVEASVDQLIFCLSTPSPCIWHTVDRSKNHQPPLSCRNLPHHHQMPLNQKIKTVVLAHSNQMVHVGWAIVECCAGQRNPGYSWKSQVPCVVHWFCALHLSWMS